MRTGMLVTGPTRTAVDLAGMTRGRGRPLLADDDLLVLLEGIIDEHSTGPRAGLGCLRPLEAMATDLRRMSRVRGVARVRQALERALPAVDSALETRMRLLLEAFGLRGWVTDIELTLDPATRDVVATSANNVIVRTASFAKEPRMTALIEQYERLVVPLPAAGNGI